MNWALLGNSLALAGISALLALMLGGVTALFYLGVERPWRSWLLAGAVVALALPPFLVANSWIHAMGLLGLWWPGLPVNLYSYGGSVAMLTLLFWPIPFLLVASVGQRLELAHLEADPLLVGWPLIRWLLMPMAAPMAGTAAVVVFVLALNNFTVPALLQVRVYPVEVWLEFNTHLDAAAAFRTIWPLLLTPLVLLLYFRRRDLEWPTWGLGVPARCFRRRLGACEWWGCAVVSVVTWGSALGFPLIDLLGDAGTWQALLPALEAGSDAVGNSFALAALTATLVIGLGVVTWRWRWGVWLWPFFLVPGVLLGVGLIVLFNREPFLGFYRSLGIVLLAWLIRYLAVGWSGVSQAMRAVDHELLDSARCEGATPWQRFWQVAVPLTRRRLAAVWLVVYLLCLWEVETAVLIAPPGGETVAARVFGFLHYGHNAQVNALCLVLVGLGLAPMAAWALWERLRRRGACRAVVAAAIGAALGVAGCAPEGPSITPLRSLLFEGVQIIGSRGTGLGQFNKPRSVAVDRADNLYVADLTGRIQKFSSSGQFLSYWQMPVTDLGKPKGMCLDEQGNIVVLEPHYSRVNHFSPDGTLVDQWGERGTNRGQLGFPRAVAINLQGDVYVSEYGLAERVQRFSRQPRLVQWVLGMGGSEGVGFNRAEGLGLDPEGRLYVADSCHHRIQIFSAQGVWLRAYGRPGHGRGDLSYPYDVRVDAQGRQFVCEFGNSRIQIFDANDRVLELLGGPGAAAGQFNNPWAIALDSRGNLYVADSQNHRVQKFIARASASVNPPRSPAPRPP